MKLDMLIIAIAPSLSFLTWIYIKDKYEKEPIKFLIKIFFIGALISIPAIAIEDFLMRVNINNEHIKLIYIAFVVAALTEEFLKYIVLRSCVLSSKHYNEKLDGIVYSVFLTLGFATIENIIYIFGESYLNVLELGISRALISIPAHIMFSITMGYYLSVYKFGKNEKKKIELFKALFLPILFHGVFDFLLIIKVNWFTTLFLIYLIYLWKLNVDKLNRYTNYSRKRFIRRKRKLIKDNHKKE